jgi:hypothetical protein
MDREEIRSGMAEIGGRMSCCWMYTGKTGVSSVKRNADRYFAVPGAAATALTLPGESDGYPKPNRSRINMYHKIAILLLFWFAAATVSAEPAQVILLRHAEKPAAGDGLSPKGQQRAAALAPYFLQTEELMTHGEPIAVYAQQPSDSRPSRRSVETVKPLARALAIKVRQYRHSECAKMVKSIRENRKYEGKTVVICFEHDALPEIAAALGVSNSPKWPGHAFDRIWIITFNHGKSTLRDLPQKLMYGDSSR